jgi:phospho-N-acetylmuramoyl-pentapeptide-transferase
MLYYLFQYLDQTLQVSGTGVFSTLLLDQHLHLFSSLLLVYYLWKRIIRFCKINRWEKLLESWD